MNRRDFFKLTGLGAGALFIAPTVLAAAWTDVWQAEDAVKFAVAHALAQGATYADARIGPCVLTGHETDFAPLGLLDTDLLGMRICTPQGWRKLVIRDFDRAAIQDNLAHAFQPAQEAAAPRTHWLTAQFCKHTVLAQRSSDDAIDAQINMAMLRYGQQLAMPAHGPHILFCDILLHQ